MAEEAQVDWGAFGAIRIGRGVRPLSGFVMVLSYSRDASRRDRHHRTPGPLLAISW